jgi:XTP/dITP diphosphohydrolase
VILLVGTRSSGKQREVRRLLADPGIDVRFPDDVGVFEELGEDVLELADSYEANARAKAEYFSRRTGLPTVADDSGLEVFALGGAPGVRSKRWAGVQAQGAALDAANNTELLRRLAGAPVERRRGRFRCVLAYYPRPGAPHEVFEGSCPGTILSAPRGTDGFGYDPLFLSDELGKTLAEATDEEKDRVSHRGIAFRAFRERLAQSKP